MAGIYIHIPFCKQACHYCNFHFSTSLKQKSALLDALLIELQERAPELSQQSIRSVYFGGGTPSLLTEKDLHRIFEALNHYYDLSRLQECTLEANPDDLTGDKIAMLAVSPVDRLSIGIQSFRDADLQFMNRAHNAHEAMHVVDQCRDAGFNKLTIDLIYGVPGMDEKAWESNLSKLEAYQLPHFSAYALTVEPKTALHHFVKTGKSPQPDEEMATTHFQMLQSFAESQKYEQYEISNFALNGQYAIHNSSYWHQTPYVGIGPAAHSFDGHNIRRWNVANNALYIRNIQEGQTYFETETLNVKDQFNEYMLTGLRTRWGVDRRKIETYGSSYLLHFDKEVQSFLQDGLVLQKDTIFTLSKKGQWMADYISAQLFYEE